MSTLSMDDRNVEEQCNRTGSCGLERTLGKLNWFMQIRENFKMIELVYADQRGL